MAKNKKIISVPIIKNGVPNQDWKPASVTDYADIFQNSLEAMIMLDTEELIRFWNKGAENLFGFISEEMVGKKFYLVLDADGIEPSLAAGVSTMKGQRKDGSKFPLELSLGAKESHGRLRLIIAKMSLAKLSDSDALKKSEENHTRAQKQLEYRIRFESLISSISTHFIHLSSDRIDMGINYALHAIGEFEKVDRAYIFLFSPDQGFVENSHEWCSLGVEPQIQSLKEILVSRYPWFMKRIRAFETIYIPKVSEMPDEAQAERKEFERKKIQSLVIVPLVHRGSLRGYLGFDFVNRQKEWSDEVIELLRIVGEMFINALERKKVDQALRDAKSKYLNIF